MLFAQVGELASSKSAMKTLAPELSALMIILRSTGPVISTRRSARSAGIGATLQASSSRIDRFGPIGEQAQARRLKRAIQVADESECVGAEDFAEPWTDFAGHGDARHACQS